MIDLKLEETTIQRFPMSGSGKGQAAGLLGMCSDPMVNLKFEETTIQLTRRSGRRKARLHDFQEFEVFKKVVRNPR